MLDLQGRIYEKIIYILLFCGIIKEKNGVVYRLYKEKFVQYEIKFVGNIRGIFMKFEINR